MNNCPECGRPYGERKRCYHCHGRSKTGEDRACEQCGKVFHVAGWQIRNKDGRNEGRYCSIGCKAEAQKGHSHNPDSKFLHSSGYVMVFAPEHPRATRARVMEHILVAEQMLGRPLLPNERVHHKNHDRTNNDPANLEVFTNSAHSSLHGQEKSERARANAPRVICTECGTEFLVKPCQKDTKKFCSNACRLVALHRAARDYHRGNREARQA